MSSKQDLLNKINNSLKLDNLPLMETKTLNTIVLDTSRILDKEVVIALKQIKSKLKINLNSDQREQIRLFLIGYPNDQEKQFEEYKIKANNTVLNKAYEYIFNGIERREKEVLSTIISRYKLYFLHIDNKVTKKYLKYIEELQRNKYQLIYLNVNAKSNLSSNDINNVIKSSYDELSNYHNFIINFKNSDDKKVSWNTIAKVAIYMENFLMEKNFKVFQNKNRGRRIEDLDSFIDNNKNLDNSDNLKKAVAKFYEGVSYGFRFVDLFISNDGKTKSLVMQKVQLDETPRRCPACFQIANRGNSYPKLLFKSFECQNPSCPARSKSGRGKRFDLLSAKNQIMLKRNNSNDKISDKIYSEMRRDITNGTCLNVKTMIQLYTWSGDNVLIINNDNDHSMYKGRKLKYKQFSFGIKDDLFSNLPLVNLLKSINDQISNKASASFIDNKVNKDTLIVNDNSDNIFHYKNKFDLQITSAITSPPYYNAREYSQWTNFLCYLIDMMINAKSVYNSIDDNSVYIYNVGDIVDMDYIYIKSHMSQRRLMLGFYSSLIFKLAGFDFKNDIIWDKGEVQSKRNSSPNHFSGYLKPVNSYEHDLLFVKGDCSDQNHLLDDKVIYIPPVKKINSRGKNTYGHTAPFPEELARLIIPFSTKYGYILDPFLGSGTTCIVANNTGHKSIGFELSPKYYKLAIERLENRQLNLF